MGVRLRYTLLYGAMVLVSGLGLLAIVGALSTQSTMQAPAGGAHAPAEVQIARLQEQLAESDEAHARQLLLGLITGLGVTVLLSLLLGRFLAGRVLRPLRVLTQATRRITADNLHQRLAVRGPADEVKALADTIDDLLARLEESFAAQRRFVADASHELRTPLATMRASVDVAMAKPGPVPQETAVLADRVRGSLDEVDRLLEGFLLLARAQHGAFDDREAVSLTALASELLRSRTDDDVDVFEDLHAEVATRGNPVLLARLVGNVIDNAFRHNAGPRGWVRVSVAARGSEAVLEVESTGEVLDSAQVAALGRPFHRLGRERTGSGTGLGLSIVDAVAAAHGGRLSLAARPDGGLLVTVALPLAVAVPA
ncbi:sensor histidine kinase [Actinoplanes sp. CA-142083]|uniref:sensor histidine kinase n=1 Tax=Actinoplanes sp. CA-142083 TaxID=3239903 RepID=UPI003D8AEA3D